MCERCKEILNPSTSIRLDLNWRTNEFRKEPWPEEDSQGGFAFGRACAQRILDNGGKIK